MGDKKHEKWAQRDVKVSQMEDKSSEGRGMAAERQKKTKKLQKDNFY